MCSVEDPSAGLSHFCLCALRVRAANMSDCCYVLPGVWHSWKKPNLNKIRGFLQPLITETVVSSIISTAQEEEQLNPHTCFPICLSWTYLIGNFVLPWCRAMCLGQPEKHENGVLSSAKNGISVKAVVLLGPAPSQFIVRQAWNRIRSRLTEGFPFLWSQGIVTHSRSNVDWMQKVQPCQRLCFGCDSHNSWVFLQNLHLMQQPGILGFN